MTRKRERFRPSQTRLPRTNKALTAIVVVGVVLTLLMLLRGSLGSNTARFINEMTRDPTRELPDSGPARTLDSIESTQPATLGNP